MELFGFEINRKKEPKAAQSFVAPDSDGALEAIRGGGYYGTYFDVEGVANTEEQLIKRYRDISMYADIDTAIEEMSSMAGGSVQGYSLPLGMKPKFPKQTKRKSNKPQVKRAKRQRRR